jgi:protein SCO1/2
MNRLPIAVSVFVCLFGFLAYVAVSQYFPSSKPSFTATDITGATIGQAPWSLQDAQGAAKTAADYKGKIAVVFFGFTRCPDVCPTTMVDFAAAIKAMGKDGEKVQVLFATLDPERDTFPALQQYTSAFNPSFVALRGDEAATKAAAASFKVFYAKSKGADGKPENYTIDHTAASFVFDPKGNMRLFVRNGQPVDTIAKDLLQLLR